MRVLSLTILGFLAFHVSALPQSYQDRDGRQRQQPTHRQEPNEIKRFGQGVEKHWNEWQQQNQDRNAEADDNRRRAGISYSFDFVNLHQPQTLFPGGVFFYLHLCGVLNCETAMMNRRGCVY